MGLLTARVKHAERMMTLAAATNQGIEITFADGCKGLIPFAEIPEVGKPSDLTGIELPNPYQVNIRSSKGELAELPWDFVRHYCEATYRSQVEVIASEGMQALGKRIRAIRESIGMTQAELAAAAKIGRVTEVRIENGEQSPRYKTLVAIAQALKLPLTDLLIYETST
jgi:DNA-binding XRE family transcriptional regulator